MGRRPTLKRNYDDEGNLISKECCCCYEIKPVSEFYKSKRTFDGFYSKCKECAKKYNQENKESRKEYDIKKYQKNKDKIRERQKKYDQENKDEISKKKKEHRIKQIQETLQQIKIEVEADSGKYNYTEGKEIYGIIYLVHNIKSDKYYVGQSINSFDIRYPSGWLYEHGYKNTVKEDLELYGEESFEYAKILKVAHSQYELDKLEAYYIDYYDSYEKGYNENRGNIFTNRGKEKII